MPFSKEKKSMGKHKKIKYRNKPIGKTRIVPDFLPSSKHLVLQEETDKITLALIKESLKEKPIN